MYGIVFDFNFQHEEMRKMEDHSRYISELTAASLKFRSLLRERFREEIIPYNHRCGAFSYGTLGEFTWEDKSY